MSTLPSDSNPPYLSNFRSLAGFTLQISSATMIPLTVDGGFKISSDANKTFDSVGILYPGERVDLLLQWDEPAAADQSLLYITLDPEYFTSILLPPFAPTDLLKQEFQIPQLSPPSKPNIPHLFILSLRSKSKPKPHSLTISLAFRPLPRHLLISLPAPPTSRPKHPPLHQNPQALNRFQPPNRLHKPHNLHPSNTPLDFPPTLAMGYPPTSPLHPLPIPLFPTPLGRYNPQQPRRRLSPLPSPRELILRPRFFTIYPRLGKL